MLKYILIIFRKAVPLMENEKNTFPKEELAAKRVTPFIDGTIDDISELSTPSSDGEAEVNPLDSLLYESEESDVTDTDEEPDSFESFFAEYRQLIAENLDAARKMNTEEQSDESGYSGSIEEAESLSAAVAEPAPAKAKKEKKKQTEENSEWSGDITLEPEEYEPLDEESEIFNVEPEQEEEIDLLGAQDLVPEAISDSEDNIQLSFFAEEKTTEIKNGEEPEERKYDPENPRKIDTVFDFLELFIFTLVAVMVLTSFVFKHSVVEGDSMNNTLEEGDHLIVWDAFYTPDRYDIIVFEDYSTILKKAVVKRVIGLPGETVEIKNGEDGVFLVYVNGELIEEDYAYHGIRYSSPNTGVWKLGEDEIFVMGDNRYNSADSRDENVGPIKIDSVLGKVVLRFYPFGKFGTFN